MAWILPAAMAVSAGAQLWGAVNQNKTNKKNQKLQDQRYQEMQGLILPMLNQGGDSTTPQMTALADFLGSMDFSKAFGGGNQAWNTGQDALMQFLREDPYDTTELFKSWEPIEARSLNEALAGAFGQATGLGQRFGSAMMREEGKVRGEAAENAIARREGAQMQNYESTKGRQMQAAGALGNMGSAYAQNFIQFLLGQMGGYQALGQLGQQNKNNDTALLQILFGGGPGGYMPNAMPGAGADVMNMAMLLPMLMQLSAGGGKTPVNTGPSNPYYPQF